MSIPNRPPSQNKYPVQYMENTSYDEDYGVLARLIVGYDGTSLQRILADNLQLVLTSDGTYDYFCMAAPGTATNTAKWMVFRLDNDGNKMFADADANFDNVATNPAGLSYSYS